MYTATVANQQESETKVAIAVEHSLWLRWPQHIPSGPWTCSYTLSMSNTQAKVCMEIKECTEMKQCVAKPVIKEIVTACTSPNKDLDTPTTQKSEVLCAKIGSVCVLVFTFWLHLHKVTRFGLDHVIRDGTNASYISSCGLVHILPHNTVVN